MCNHNGFGLIVYQLSLGGIWESYTWQDRLPHSEGTVKPWRMHKCRRIFKRQLPIHFNHELFNHELFQKQTFQPWSLGMKSPQLKLGVEISCNNIIEYMIKKWFYDYREMVKLVNQCHPVKLQMEVAIQWQFVFLMELEEWFNVSAAPDLQVGEKSIIIG